MSDIISVMNKTSYHNCTYIVGIDEVGRGPIAGPVTVGAFLVTRKHQARVNRALPDITDSKKLTEGAREDYTQKIRDLADQGLCQFVTSSVSAQVIDHKGISYAIRLAIRRCVTKLALDPKLSFIYLDGGLSAPEPFDQETVIKGDEKIWQISAASVVAKVTRDHVMIRYSKHYSGYGFETHKGYGTKNHRSEIKKRGVCDLHRKTWIKN